MHTQHFSNKTPGHRGHITSPQYRASLLSQTRKPELLERSYYLYRRTTQTPAYTQTSTVYRNA